LNKKIYYGKEVKKLCQQIEVKIEIKPIGLQVVLNHNIRLWKFMAEISWNLFHEWWIPIHCFATLAMTRE